MHAALLNCLFDKLAVRVFPLKTSSCHLKLTYYCTGCRFVVVLSDSITKYYEVNETLPRCIVIYRNCVSDGDILAVREHEVSRIRESIHSASPG